MKGVDLLEKTYNMFGNKVSELLSTHPDAASRSARMKEVVRELAPPGQKNEYINKTYAVIDKIFYWAGRHVFENLEHEKSIGVVPFDKNSQRVLGSDKPIILGIVPERRAVIPSIDSE